jgi:hypothetical protein
MSWNAGSYEEKEITANRAPGFPRWRFFISDRPWSELREVRTV